MSIDCYNFEGYTSTRTVFVLLEVFTLSILSIHSHNGVTVASILVEQYNISIGYSGTGKGEDVKRRPIVQGAYSMEINPDEMYKNMADCQP